jgi:hypothetical protein
MTYRERSLGNAVVFLLPSLKLKEPSLNGPSIENKLHVMDNFGGYTAQAGNIFGYRREEEGRDSYGEHREFSVAVLDDSQIPKLKKFLAGMALDLKEECIYFRAGDTASLIYRTSMGDRYLLALSAELQPRAEERRLALGNRPCCENAGTGRIAS